MAGTGGTSSPSVDPDAPCMPFVFGCISLIFGVDTEGGSRGCPVVSEVRICALLVALGGSLFVISGVVRPEFEGAATLVGSKDGDLDKAALSLANGGMSGILAISLMPCVWGIMESRFIRRVSVGLIVLAPKPLAWELLPGIIEALLDAEFGVDVLLDTRGDREASDSLFASVAVAAPNPGMVPACVTRGGGCTDFALDARVFAARKRDESDPSTDERAESLPVPSATRLVLRRCVARPMDSVSLLEPGTMDLRACFGTFVPDTGG